MNASRWSVASHPGFLPWMLAVAVLFLLVAPAADAAPGFRTSSLFGTFSAVGAGDGHTSVSVGTVTYDGAGSLTRSLVVNAPDGAGGRRLITFESVGTYEVNADGTGVIFLVNTIGNGTTTEVTMDFVIQEAKPAGRGGGLRATKIFSMQREAGTTVGLVTANETLLFP